MNDEKLVALLDEERRKEIRKTVWEAVVAYDAAAHTLSEETAKVYIEEATLAIISKFGRRDKKGEIFHLITMATSTHRIPASNGSYEEADRRVDKIANQIASMF